MLLLFVLLAVLVIPSHPMVVSSGYICSGAGWEIDNSDKQEMFVKFQNWLYAWQNNCKLPIYEGLQIGNGIGSSIMAESNWFEYAFEHGAIYRPSSTYNWADADPTNCTFSGIASVECYYEPLSTCPGLPGAILPTEYALTKSPEQLEHDRSFCNFATDSCTLARLAKKSLQWVQSNIIYYATKPNRAVQAEISRRGTEVEKFLASAELRERKGSTVSVHMRGGDPQDGRRTLALSDYIVAIDALAAELAAQGRPVAGVFLSSDTPEDNFKSVAFMTSAHPRPWKYLAIPQFRVRERFADGTKETSEYVVDHPDEQRELVYEFLTDMHYLARMDVFLGSHSNMYPVVVARRIALNVNGENKFRRHSCVLLTSHAHSAYTPPTVHCEGSEEAKGIWKILSRGGYNTDCPSLFDEPVERLQ